MRSISKVILAALLLTGLSFAGDKDNWRRNDRHSHRSYDRSRDSRYYNGYNNYYRNYSDRDYRPYRYYNVPPGIAKKQWRNDQYRHYLQNRRNRWQPWW